MCKDACLQRKSPFAMPDFTCGHDTGWLAGKIGSAEFAAGVKGTLIRSTFLCVLINFRSMCLLALGMGHSQPPHFSTPRSSSPSYLLVDIAFFCLSWWEGQIGQCG